MPVLASACVDGGASRDERLASSHQAVDGDASVIPETIEVVSAVPAAYAIDARVTGLRGTLLTSDAGDQIKYDLVDSDGNVVFGMAGFAALDLAPSGSVATTNPVFDSVILYRAPGDVTATPVSDPALIEAVQLAILGTASAAVDAWGAALPDVPSGPGCGAIALAAAQDAASLLDTNALADGDGTGVGDDTGEDAAGQDGPTQFVSFNMQNPAPAQQGGNAKNGCASQYINYYMLLTALVVRIGYAIYVCNDSGWLSKDCLDQGTWIAKNALDAWNAKDNLDKCLKGQQAGPPIKPQLPPNVGGKPKDPGPPPGAGGGAAPGGAVKPADPGAPPGAGKD